MARFDSERPETGARSSSTKFSKAGDLARLANSVAKSLPFGSVDFLEK